MKKSIAVFIVVLAMLGIVSGQSPLAVGENQLNAGVGLSSWGIPLYIGLDHQVHSDISVGGEISFRNYRESYKHDHYRHNIMGISANGNYHFNRILTIPKEWDFYAGLNLGFYIWSSPDPYPGDHGSGLGLGIQIGGRYYFNDKVGINLEFGGGNAFSDGKFGISVKL